CRDGMESYVTVREPRIGPEEDGQDGERPGEEGDGARVVVLADRVERTPPRGALHRSPAGKDPEGDGQEKADVADRLAKGVTGVVVTGLRSEIPAAALFSPRSSPSGVHPAPPSVSRRRKLSLHHGEVSSDVDDDVGRWL